MSITVIGTVALDSIETPLGKHERILGGSGLHFSNAASVLSKINLVAVVGNDFPREGKEFLLRRKVDIEGLEVIPDGKTFFWEGRYEGDMNQAFTVKTELNVLENFNPKVPDKYWDCRILFLANIDPDLQNKVLDQLKGQPITVLDTMNFWIHNKRESLKKAIRRVNMVILNEQEIRMLTGIHNLVKAGREMLQWGPEWIVIKKGEYGVSLMSSQGMVSVPAYPVENLVDPTGAGDSFAGGMMSYLDYHDSMELSTLQRALNYGTMVASHYVEGFGIAGFENVNMEKLEARYKEFRAMQAVPETLFLSRK